MNRLPTSHPWAPALLLLAVAIASRAALYGNPIVHGDDQFYLLVGDRIWAGDWPYVDIWDRKPIGLFLIYAAIRALGADGVLAYQIVATLFAWATAMVVRRIALRLTDPRAALAAAIAYLLLLCVFGGEAGQSPVFYNLPVALAAWAVLAAITRPRFDRRALLLGTGAMALLGMAIQIKYTVVFEGAFFGCALLWRAAREAGVRIRLAGLALVWIAVALTPTAAAWAVFAAHGHGAEFVFANFESIFSRRGEAWNIVLGRLERMTRALLPLIVAAGIGLVRAKGSPDARLVAGWLAAAAGAVLIFGSYFDHYMLPLLLPLAVAAAPALGAPVPVRIGARQLAVPVAPLLIGYAAVMAAVTIHAHVRERGSAAEGRALAARIGPIDGMGLFVFDSEPILYHLAHACPPTRWAYSDHLLNPREDGGTIGVDPAAEVARIMAARPAWVVTSAEPQLRMNRRALAALEAGLRDGYRPAARVRAGKRTHLLWRDARDTTAALPDPSAPARRRRCLRR